MSREVNSHQSAIAIGFELVDIKKGTFRVSSRVLTFSCDLRYCMDFLRRQADINGLTQSRLCLHTDDDALLQKMVVFHSTSHRVRRHCHRDKDEYLMIVGGEVLVRIYTEDGKNMYREYCLGTDPDQETICYVPRNTIHDMKILRDACFLETTTGPFNSSSTSYL